MQTPYYLIDKQKLLKNMQKMQQVRELSGAKLLLALKCFASWSVFDLMQDYMDGTTSSSLYEVKLGKEKFEGETHAYSVAWSAAELPEVLENCDKIIFNSFNQLASFGEQAKAAGKACGLRVNPGVSSSSFDLADPARPFSRLGETDPAAIQAVLPQISGFMFHNNCENSSLEKFSQLLDVIEEKFGELLHQVEWVSLGGGIHFTGEDYPLAAFCQRLKAFSDKFGVQVYLEPGEAAITNTTSLEVTVLDVLDRGKQLAIVDSSIEAHLLDLLIYRETAQLEPNTGSFTYQVCGKSCLAGDIFGEFNFEQPLKVGDRLSFQDTGGYTLVKKNWFNGVKMPAIVVKQLDGSLEEIKDFGYADFVAALS